MVSYCFLSVSCDYATDTRLQRNCCVNGIVLVTLTLKYNFLTLKSIVILQSFMGTIVGIRIAIMFWHKNCFKAYLMPSFFGMIIANEHFECQARLA